MCIGKLSIKFRIYILIIIFFSSINIPLFSSTNSKLNESESKIQLDYLNKIPETEYILGSGDRLLILVSRDYPELTTNINIDGEGTIFLPKLNRIFVEGLTPNELISLLNQAYKEFVKFPDVQVRVINYRPIKVVIKGEVDNPGLHRLNGSFSYEINNFPFSPSLEAQDNKFVTQNKFISDLTPASFVFPTVFDAIQKSGGITEYADISSIEVIRNNSISKGGGKIKTILNFQDLINKGNSKENIRIYDSDVIVVNRSETPNKQDLRKAIQSNLNPMFVDVYVAGRVNNPGKLTISKEGSLKDALDMAGVMGGLKGPVRFIRFNNDGSVDKRKFSFPKNRRRGSYRNPTLKNGDIIILDNTLITSSAAVISEITAPFVGLYSSYGLFKAILD